MNAVVSRSGRTLRLLVVEFARHMIAQVVRAYAFVEGWLLDRKKGRYGLAVTRILIGLGGIGMLVSNWSSRFYTFGDGMAWTGELEHPSSDFPSIWLFSGFRLVQHSEALFTLGYLVLGVLALLMVLGWRTKIVLPLYLIGFVSFIELNDKVGDQSDNMYRMLMIVLLFADTSSRWSLDARRRRNKPTSMRRHLRIATPLKPFSNLTHNLGLVIITMHVAFVYGSGALYKAQGETWSHGFAIYNPLHVERFSTWPEISDWFTKFGPLVVALGWGTIIIQIMFLPMLMNRITRITALIVILSFHLGIAVFMGLPWFSMAMIAIDAIFVRDATWRSMSASATRAWALSKVVDAPVPAAVAEPVEAASATKSETSAPDPARPDTPEDPEASRSTAEPDAAPDAAPESDEGADCDAVVVA